jgi:Zn-finger nucleic acid-binding protein
MPLLISPIDGSPMKQIVRNGVELDICPTTGGVWLDKGELEKLLALVQEAVDDDEDDFRRFKQAKAGGRITQDDYYHDPRYVLHPPKYRKYDDDDYDDYHKYKHGKKSKLKSILNLFD